MCCGGFQKGSMPLRILFHRSESGTPIFLISFFSGRVYTHAPHCRLLGLSPPNHVPQAALAGVQRRWDAVQHQKSGALTLAQRRSLMHRRLGPQSPTQGLSKSQSSPPVEPGLKRSLGRKGWLAGCRPATFFLCSLAPPSFVFSTDFNGGPAPWFRCRRC